MRIRETSANESPCLRIESSCWHQNRGCITAPGLLGNIRYARVWTLDQNLDLQMQALRKAGAKKIFREKLSGAERPEFQRMPDQLRNSDTVIVWKLDRLARSTRDFLETMETIREAGVRFQSLFRTLGQHY